MKFYQERINTQVAKLIIEYIKANDEHRFKDATMIYEEIRRVDKRFHD